MEQTKFDVWRRCWEHYLLGEQTNPDGIYEQQVIASIDRMASLELDFKGFEDESECTISTPIFGLRAQAMAYRTKGSRYYKDRRLFDSVLEGLEEFHRTVFNVDNAPDIIENWWLFEVGAPLRILDILVLFYDDLDDPMSWVMKYTDVMLHFKDAYLSSSHGKPETGANLMWKCHNLRLIGILRHEQEWIDWANERIPSLLQYSHAIQVPRIGTMYDDGFYPDGSFIQHYMFSYTGGYGKHLLSIMTGDLYAFHGQECLILPEENRNFLFRMVKEAYLPLLYKGHMMDVCRGREPSRYWCQDDAAGALILRALLYLRETLPEEQEQELDGLLKEQLTNPATRQSLFYDFHPSAEYFVSPSLAERLYALDKSETETAAPMSVHRNYGVMCKPVHRTSKYALAVSMYSRNIACYEKLMLESNRLWHFSDGATFLYTGAGDTYSGDFYATADTQRLAGTTVERSPHRTEDPYYSWYLPEARNVYAFAGGVTLDSAGIAGQQYRGQGNGKERSLEVKKSWFMFEDEIVCLGSGITSVTDNPVETVIANDRLTDGHDEFHVFTKDGEIRPESGEETVIFTDRLFITQGEETEGCGYLFPGGAELHLLKEHRQGTWNSVKLNPDHISENDHLTVWISHGSHPDHASYAYAILPACTREAWMLAAETPAFEIVENSEAAHSVRNLREHLLGINFWQEEAYVCEGIECSTQASILCSTQKVDGTQTMAVADSTKQNRRITLRIPDCSVEVMIDTEGLDGGACMIEI